jgi:hypothetical protein
MCFHQLTEPQRGALQLALDPHRDQRDDHDRQAELAYMRRQLAGFHGAPDPACAPAPGLLAGIADAIAACPDASELEVLGRTDEVLRIMELLLRARTRAETATVCGEIVTKLEELQKSVASCR